MTDSKSLAMTNDSESVAMTSDSESVAMAKYVVRNTYLLQSTAKEKISNARIDTPVQA